MSQFPLKPGSAYIKAYYNALILRLIGQIITVSLETMKIVNALPSLNFDVNP